MLGIRELDIRIVIRDRQLGIRLVVRRADVRSSADLNGRYEYKLVGMLDSTYPTEA